MSAEYKLAARLREQRIDPSLPDPEVNLQHGLLVRRDLHTHDAGMAGDFLVSARLAVEQNLRSTRQDELRLGCFSHRLFRGTCQEFGSLHLRNFLVYWFSENWKFAFEGLAWFVRPAVSLVTL